jgi:hypothetical protein
MSPYSIAVAAEAVAAEATTVVRAAASMAMNRVTVRIGNPPRYEAATPTFGAAVNMDGLCWT